MEREQFTFYGSFARAGRRIKKTAERCAFYDAVIDYALDGKLPDLDSVPESVGMAMELVLPVLTASRNKAANRINKGKQQTGTNENKREQTENKSLGGKTSNEKEREKEKEGEREKEKENECSISPPTPSPEDFFSGDLLAAVRDWLSYKRERRESYKPTGLRIMFSHLVKAAGEYGDAAVADVIRSSMASGYQGITLDRLSRPQPKKKSYTPAADYVPPAANTEDLEKLRKEFGL